VVRDPSRAFRNTWRLRPQGWALLPRIILV
jgi:hypothetical protein